MNIVARIRHDASLTQHKLAELSGLSTIFIIRAEQSLPVELPNHLLVTLADIGHISIEEIQGDYLLYRQQQIDRNFEEITNHPDNKFFVEQALGYAFDNYMAPVGKRSNHPFYLFRTRLMLYYGRPQSAIKFATYFGIHPSVISDIESRKGTLEGVTATRVARLGLNAVQMEMLTRACDQCL